jgi:beta-glucanase (GH16 family)
VWPFDNGQANYIILNIALGGSWPGPVDATTTFPVTMLVDYVRLYTN